MKSKGCSIKFYTKESILKDGNTHPIYCRIVYDRKKAEFYIGENVAKSKWSDATGMPSRDKHLEGYLIKIKSDILESKRNLELYEREISAKILRDLYRYGGEKEVKLFFPFFDEQVEKMKQQTDKYTHATIQKYAVTRNHFKAFLKTKRKDDLPISHINLEIIEGFNSYLRTTPSKQFNKPMAQNTANQYHKKIKHILKLAIKANAILKNPYQDFPLKYDPVERPFLTQDELDTLINSDLAGNKSLDKVRDIFVFSCYTGLRFRDAQNLTEENIYKDSDGYWLTFKQMKNKKKTKELFPMLSPAVKIYHKYAFEREITGRVLPKISNTKVNTYLKTIADLIGVKKKLSHHISRHTFATTVTLANDMPLEMVSAFLGHSDIKTTQIYAKITPGFKLKYAKAINKKIENR